MLHKKFQSAKWLLALGLLGGATMAQAGEGPFGWLQTLDLQPKGKFEFEQRVDDSHRQSSGKYDWVQYRSELEYGVSSDFQIAAYLNANTISANNNYNNPEVCGSGTCTAGFGVPASVNGTTNSYHRTSFDGVSLEGVYRITNPVTSPVGVGVYVESTFGKLEDEFETRLMLQSNFLDDRLILAMNILSNLENETYPDDGSVIKNSMGDILYGASYRFAPKWSGGLEGRLHTDFDGSFYQSHSQTANFIGPVVHYAEKDWWVTAAWRHQLSGKCYNNGTADCSDGYVSDNHGRDQFIVRVGIPIN